MAFVLDCSVALAWIFPDEATEATNRLRDSLTDGRAFAPALWPIEVANVLLVATRRGRIASDEWEQLYANLEALPIEIDPVSTSRVGGRTLQLAHAHRLSVDDAMYLELALRMHLPLATLDRALGEAARTEGLKTPASA